MPPKKKCTHKSRKAELVFLERPQEGPVHCYETPLRSAENPRRVPTKPVDRNTSAAWQTGAAKTVPLQQQSSPRGTLFKHYCCLTVRPSTKEAWELLFQTCMKHSFVPGSCIGKAYPTCPLKPGNHIVKVCPQFETTKSVVLKACQKQHCGPHKRQNQDVSHGLFHAGGACQRATACTFPSLSFKNPDRYAVHPLDHPNHSRKNTQRSHSQPKKGTTAKANIQVNSLENCSEIPLLPAPQPVEPEVCSSSDVDSPQVPSITNWRCSSTLPQQSSHAWHPEKEQAFSIDSCGRGESAAILVTDTPKHEYGVKVTWRQRPHLMKYLQERGKLGAADVLVKANSELSSRQAAI